MAKKRLIDADEAVRISKEERFMWAYDLTDLEEFLADVPTVDAVEVVRCKDCKHYNVFRLECHNGHMNGIIGIDGFCSYGERRVEDVR